MAKGTSKQLAQRAAVGEDYERAIGRLSIAWAQVEHGLDECISIIHRDFGGNALAASLPLGARAKIRYFRQAVERIPALAHASEKANNLAKVARYVLQERNWCIHGVVLQHIDDVPPASSDAMKQAIELTRLARPSLDRYEKKRVTVAHIDDVVKSLCGPISLGFAMFMFDPLRGIPAKRVDHVFRKLGLTPPSERANFEYIEGAQ